MGDEGSTAELATNIHWTDKLEEYFASTGEKAHCLSWVHKRSESVFSTRKTYIDLPVIIGSGIIAFLNAGSSAMFAGKSDVASIALGVGSLAVGVLNTMGTYFGWAKRAEGHRISAIHYAKLYRFIHVEMSLPREERMSPHDFLKYVKDQYDRLAEISPLVPEEVIHEFQQKFKNEHEISKPEETNGLEKIEVYKASVSDRIGSSMSSVGSPVMRINPIYTPKSTSVKIPSPLKLKKEISEDSTILPVPVKEETKEEVVIQVASD